MSHIDILARKFLLKLAQDPKADELLRKHLGKEDQFEHDVFPKLLEKGIIPIKSDRGENKQTSFLGAGSYSEVFEVSYKGRLAVAKVTTTARDFNNMLTLDSLKKQLGEDAKHLPVIFDSFITKTPYRTYYIIIIEKLEPLDTHLKNMLFPQRYKGDQGKSKYNTIKNDPVDIIEKAIEHVTHSYAWTQIDKNTQTKILEMMDSAIRKSIVSSENPNQFKFNLEYITNNFLKSLEKEPNYSSISRVVYDIPYFVDKAMQYNLDFPTESISDENENENVKHFQQIPESKSFMNFLVKLKNNFNIHWGDLHFNNMMIRPETKDLVISDSGLFDV
jgi:hypothetical protein